MYVHGVWSHPLKQRYGELEKLLPYHKGDKIWVSRRAGMEEGTVRLEWVAEVIILELNVLTIPPLLSQEEYSTTKRFTDLQLVKWELIVQTRINKWSKPKRYEVLVIKEI